MWGGERVCPLNLTTGSSHLGSKNVKSGVCSSWQWVFYISVEEFLPTLLLQNCFNSAILQGFQTWMACLSYAKESQRHLCHFWLGHSKTSILFGGLVYSGSLSCCITGGFSFWNFRISPYHHTTSMFDHWYDAVFIKWCVSLMSDVMGLTKFCPMEYFHKSFGNNQDVFWQVWDKPFCSFWLNSAFSLWALLWVFAKFLFYWWNKQTVT